MTSPKLARRLAARGVRIDAVRTFDGITELLKRRVFATQVSRVDARSIVVFGDEDNGIGLAGVEELADGLEDAVQASEGERFVFQVRDISVHCVERNMPGAVRLALRETHFYPNASHGEARDAVGG